MITNTRKIEILRDLQEKKKEAVGSSMMPSMSKSPLKAIVKMMKSKVKKKKKY